MTESRRQTPEHDETANGDDPTLARRSVISVGWSLGASAIRIATLFARSVILARFVPIEAFGVYALAVTIVELTLVPAKLGTNSALLHRSEHTRDEGAAAATHLTLNLGLLSTWAVVVGGAAWFFADGALQWALVFVALWRAVHRLGDTPAMLLQRRVVHRRLSLVTVVSAVISTAVAAMLAMQGAGLWALLSIEAVNATVGLGLLFVWRPVWRPRLRWHRPEIAYFIDFGRRQMIGTVLGRLLYRLDDLWVGTVLGDRSLGLYSRAYAFGRYPSLILGAPLQTVVGGTLASLKHRRRQLSRAFFTANAFLIRGGFLIAGLLLVTAPELIPALIGERWMPMLTTFRLMLIYALLNPLNEAAAQLLAMVGRPEVNARIRAVQLVVFVPLILVLGSRFDIDGVALAVDVMAMVGLFLLLRAARDHVDLSITRLVGMPSIALSLASAAALWTASQPRLPTTDWAVLTAKTVAFCAVYGGLLAVVERRQLMRIASVVLKRERP